MLYLVSSFFLASILKICTGVGEWCYQVQVNCTSHCKGPNNWYELHRDCINQRQSPINIVTKSTRLDTRLTPLIFTGYQNAFSAVVKNNGHSVNVHVPNGPTISGGNLQGTYKAVQFHFHWGEDGGPGSEHTLDGEQYPMELHIVHMRSDFSTLDEALKDPSGVAVLGFLYEESKSSNRKYDAFIQALNNVKNSNANRTINHISLSNFILPEVNMTEYYRYDGSLTTPTCAEAVVWTVFKNTIPLSRDQLTAFSTLKFTDGTPMVKTFRPVQPRNGRIVYRSYSGSVLTGSNFALLLVSFCTALGLSQLN